MTAEEGHDVQLWCPENEKDLLVIWYRKSDAGSDRIVLKGEVQHDFADHMSFDKTSGNLTIHSAQLNDSGVYYCLVGFGEAHEIRLLVLGKYHLQ